MSDLSYLAYVGLGYLSKAYFTRLIGKSVDSNNQSSYMASFQNQLKRLAFEYSKDLNNSSAIKHNTQCVKSWLLDWTDSRILDDKDNTTDIADDYRFYYQDFLWGKDIVMPVPKEYSTDINVRNRYKIMDFRNFNNYEWVNWSNFCYFWFHKYLDLGSKIFNS